MNHKALLNKLQADTKLRITPQLSDIHQEYFCISESLNSSLKAIFSLDILRVLCRNLEQEWWREAADSEKMLLLALDCADAVQDEGSKTDQPKLLACLYHIHNYAVKKKAKEDLVFNISTNILSADAENMLWQYCKTYWAVYVDKLAYIEWKKSSKMDVSQHLKPCTEELCKIIQIYNLSNFCKDNIVPVIKKLFYIYNDESSELNKMFINIFKSLSKHKEISDVKGKMKLERNVWNVIFERINEVFSLIVQNSFNCGFSDCALPYAVNFARKYFNHRPDFTHTIVSIYSDAFCHILVEKAKLTSSLKMYMNDFLISIETSTDLGYTEALKEIFPYLNAMLRLHIEYCVKSLTKTEWKSIFMEDVLDLYLKVILRLLKELPSCKQVMKCDNCKLKNGAHDAMRLSFLPRLLTNTSLKYEVRIEKVLPLLLDILETQNALKTLLTSMHCVNISKCYLKMQTDIHNDAILFYKNGYLEYSLKLFDANIGNEMEKITRDMEVASLSRSFYNKAICALDMEFYEVALISAYVSMLLGGESVFEINKHIIMVIDVKSRALKSGKESELEGGKLENSEAEVMLQMMNVFDAARHVVASKMFDGIEILFTNAEFSRLLLHEVKVYAELWPAKMPSAGVCKAYLQYLESPLEKWIMCEDETNKLLNGAHVVLSVACSVRSVCCEHFEALVNKLVERLSNLKSPTTHSDLALASCLLLQSSLRSSEIRARQQSTVDNEGDGNQTSQLPPSFTEVAGIEGPVKLAVKKLATVLERVRSNSEEVDVAALRFALEKCLSVAECVLQTLLYQEALVTGLQLAVVCTDMATVLANDLSYLRSVGALLEYATSDSPALTSLITQAGKVTSRVLHQDDCVESSQASDAELERADVVLHYISDAALFHLRIGDRDMAGRLANLVRHRILSMYADPGDTTQSNGKRNVESLQTTCPRFTELQSMWGVANCGGPTQLTLLSAAQRQYVMWKRYGAKNASWVVRSRLSEWCARGATRVCARARFASARALLARRARAAASAALCAGIASVALWLEEQLALGRLAASCGKVDEAKVKINAVRCMLEVDKMDKINFKNNSKTEKQVITEPEQTLQKRDVNFTMVTPMEIVLDSSETRKPQMLHRPGSPCFHFVEMFCTPLFFHHPEGCACEPCNSINYILAYLELTRLEALMYFKSGESRMAQNFFDGCREITVLSKVKVEKLIHQLKSFGFSDIVCEIADGVYKNKLIASEFGLFMDLGCFLMSENNLESAYEYTKKALDMNTMDDLDALKDTVLHQLCAIKYLQKQKSKIDVKPSNEDDSCLKIQKELEMLQLSPTPKYDFKNSPKTPEIKPKVPPKIEKTKIVLKDEDLPHNPKRVVIKLNLLSDGESPEDTEAETPKKNKFFKSRKQDQSGEVDFKIPVPKIDKPVIEFNTPKRSTRKTRTAGNVAAQKKTTVSKKAALKNDLGKKESGSRESSSDSVPKKETLDAVAVEKSNSSLETYVTPSEKRNKKFPAKTSKLSLLREVKSADSTSEEIFATPSCSFNSTKKPLISHKVTKLATKEESFETSSEVFSTPSTSQVDNHKSVAPKNCKKVPKKLILSSTKDEVGELSDVGSELFGTPLGSLKTYEKGSVKVAPKVSSPAKTIEDLTPKLKVNKATRARILRANRVKLSPEVDLREKISLVRRKK